MKTTYDAVEILFGLINESDVAAAISGEVYNGQKPIGRELEDVVINCLPINNQQLQRAVLNVNIYVPSIRIKTAKGEEMVANTKRLKELTKLMIPVVDNAWQDDYHFELRQQHILQDPETKEYFNNLRIEFYSENL